MVDNYQNVKLTYREIGYYMRIKSEVIKGYKKEFSKFLIIILLTGLISKILDFIYIPLINYAELHLLETKINDLRKLIVLCVIFVIGVGITRYIHEILKIKIQKMINSALKKRWISILWEKQAEDLEEVGVGNFLFTFSKLEATSDLFSLTIAVTLSIISLIAISCYIVFFMSYLYLLLLMGILALLIISVVVSSPLERKRCKINEKEKHNITLMNNMLQSIAIIKSYFMEKKLSEQFKKNIENVAKLQLIESDYNLIMYIYAQMIRCIVMIAIPSISAYMVLNRKIEEGAIIVSTYIFFYILNHVMNIINGIKQINMLKGDLSLIEHIWSIDDVDKEVRISTVNKIYLNDLIARYDNNNIFENLSIVLPQKGLIIIKGKSGCGKSTLLKCIAGLKKFERAKIFSDNTEITQYELSRQISYAPQESIVFDISPYENIKLGNVNISDEDIDEILKEICPNVVPTFKKCKNSQHLSGGQRQLISVVRALVSESPIIVLDEPTSSLDSETVEKMMHYIRKLSQQKAILMSSHNSYVLNSVEQVYDL